jgi:CheY-like chemotaxis protein
MCMCYRIIIAEDEPTLATLLARLILRRYTTAVVQTYVDGQAALTAYEQEGADLLVVNHSMPHMNGDTLVRTLRARGDMVPIIGISGSPEPSTSFRAAGASAFVMSVDVMKDLAELLARFLPSVPCCASRAAQV